MTRCFKARARLRRLRVLVPHARRLNIPLPDAFVEAARKEIRNGESRGI